MNRVYLYSFLYYNINVMYMNEENFYKKHGNLYLTDKQIKVLDKYNIDYKKYNNLNELIYNLEYYLNNEYLSDLEQVSEELSEFFYYNCTNK